MQEQLAPFPAVRAWMDRVPHQVGRRQYTQVPMCFDPLLPTLGQLFVIAGKARLASLRGYFAPVKRFTGYKSYWHVLQPH